MFSYERSLTYFHFSSVAVCSVHYVLLFQEIPLARLFHFLCLGTCVNILDGNHCSMFMARIGKHFLWCSTIMKTTFYVYLIFISPNLCPVCCRSDINYHKLSPCRCYECVVVDRMVVLSIRISTSSSQDFQSRTSLHRRFLNGNRSKRKRSTLFFPVTHNAETMGRTWSVVRRTKMASRYLVPLKLNRYH